MTGAFPDAIFRGLLRWLRSHVVIHDHHYFADIWEIDYLHRAVKRGCISRNFPRVLSAESFECYAGGRDLKPREGYTL